MSAKRLRRDEAHAGLPAEAWMTEFIPDPEPVTEEEEEPVAGEDEIPMGDI